MNLSFQEKYDALGKGLSIYEGVFITAVITTGVFCRPSCTAKKPKKENVIFYKTTQEAIQNGFRPCKICRPMEPEAQTPTYISNILKELNKNPFLKIKDEGLRMRGIEPNRIKRWFKKHHNVTFHGYQRMLRINIAYNLILGGNTVTNTAFGLGYESISGFNEGRQNIFGKPPTAKDQKRVINIIRFTSKLGPMFACATDTGICLLEFTDRRMLETEFQDLCKHLNAVILPGKNRYLDQVQQEISQYFEGKRKSFTVPLETVGTDFQKTVWDILVKIPYGETVTYKKQASLLEKPKAVRAVASANGRNKIAVIIPCHRVIGTDGSLTGYGGGLSRKKFLLDMESRYSGKPFQLPISFK